MTSQTTQTTPTSRTGPEGGLRPVTPVAIVADTLARVVAHLDAGGDLPADLAADVRRAAAIGGGLDTYTARMTTPESEALRALAERTNTADWADRGPLEAEMLSGHVEGQLLKVLVHVTGARRVLEIGMFTGYSALAVAEALPQGGSVVACELDADVAAFAQESFAASSAGDRVEVRVGPALDTLHRLAEELARFDLVFLDADKPGYAGYLDVLLDRELLAPGALVVVDNTLMQGEPWVDAPGARSTNGEAVARFNERVAADPRVEQVLLPVRDGVSLLRRVAT